MNCKIVVDIQDIRSKCLGYKNKNYIDKEEEYVEQYNLIESLIVITVMSQIYQTTLEALCSCIQYFQLFMYIFLFTMCLKTCT